MERLLLTIREAADITALGRSTAYRLVSTGEWPTVTIGRSRRIPYDALRDWLNRQRQESTRRDPMAPANEPVVPTRAS